MYCDDWKPGYNPAFVEKIKRRRREEEVERLKREGMPFDHLITKEKPTSKRKRKFRCVIKSMTDEERADLNYKRGAPNSKMTGRQIAEMVAANGGITFEILVGKSRQKAVVSIRNQAIRTVKKLKPDFSSTQLGLIFNRDHTSILYVLGRTNRGKEIGNHE